MQRKFLQMMKDELYANNSKRDAVSPLEGVYIISTMPLMKPPPTHVAVGQITTQTIREIKSS